MRPVMRYWIGAVLLCGLSAPAARAEGPGSGDVETTRKLSPKMLRRIWRISRARRQQERRIRELKRRIATLRAALPQLQQQAMQEADKYRQAQRHYRPRRQRFLERWGRLTRLLGGKGPVSTFTDRYGRFGIADLFSSDTRDYRRAKQRRNQADGDDFLLYAILNLPKELVGRARYAVDWDLSGYDFRGNEVSFFRVYWEPGSFGFRKIRWARTRLWRRVTGLGLTPGWYSLRTTLKVAGKPWLRRTRFAVVRITRVNPLISAPPASRRRVRDPAKVRLLKLKVRSARRRRGGLDPAGFSVRGRYRVARALTGPDAHLLVGAEVYESTLDGHATGKALRVAFRFRRSLRRPRGRFGAADTTTVRHLDKGLQPGRYVLRVWVLAAEAGRDYWDFVDKPFVVERQSGAGPRAGS